MTHSSTLLPANSCHGTIVTSDCTIVTSSHHGSIRTTLQQEVYMTTFFATAP